MLRFLTAGESHGPSLTGVLEGIPSGLSLTPEMINFELSRRQRGYGSGGRMKIERDTVKILGGVLAGETTGAPIALVIENIDHNKWRSKAIEPMTVPRPGHVDLTGAAKYGYKDLRPGLERASARETAVRVAVGSVCKHFLAQFGIQVGGYVVSIGSIESDPGEMTYEERFRLAEQSDVRCPVESFASSMRKEIEKAIEGRDTLGGVIEIVVLNMPIGLGSFVQWDQRLEARLAMAVMSVQAIKGVEIGKAFANTLLKGTQVQDAIRLMDNHIVRPTNHNGGIEGGISNGLPLIIRAAMKPIPSTLKPQLTVDLASGQEAGTKYERSDFCPVPRCVPILEAMVAFVVSDVLIKKIGGDSMVEMKPRFAKLSKATLDDLHFDNPPKVYWE
ncbi:MAG: chorismate synthase [Chloroflexi bacterium]|nr:chorismate synthase [Chloroflexota bacterium]